MKNYNIYFIYITLFLIISSLITQNIDNTYNKILVFWMIFGVLIAIFEIVLFTKHKYICDDSKIKKENEYWTSNTPLKNTMDYKFWGDAWKEYSVHCDPQYGQRRNIVHWVELIHSLTAFLYIPIIYHFITNTTTNITAVLMIIITTSHITGTILYLVNLYYYLKNKNIEKTYKFWIYLSLNFFWIFMPLLILIKGIDMAIC